MRVEGAEFRVEDAASGQGWAVSSEGCTGFFLIVDSGWGLRPFEGRWPPERQAGSRTASSGPSSALPTPSAIKGEGVIQEMIHNLVHGLGFRVQGSGSRVQGSWSRDQGSGFRVVGFRVWGLRFRVRESGLRIEGLGIGFGVPPTRACSAL